MNRSEFHVFFIGIFLDTLERRLWSVMSVLKIRQSTAWCPFSALGRNCPLSWVWEWFCMKKLHSFTEKRQWWWSLLGSHTATKVLLCNFPRQKNLLLFPAHRYLEGGKQNILVFINYIKIIGGGPARKISTNTASYSLKLCMWGVNKVCYEENLNTD